MTFGFEIAPDATGQDASRIRTHGEEYDAAVQRLRDRGVGGGSWGDDGLLGPLTAVYADCSAAAVEALTGLSSVITGVGDGLRAVAANSATTETDRTREIGELGGASWG
ncbi:hypothetical protein AB0D67_08495 [Streptosporangium sp. NPDC048047]|uniref:hypothetical protein n=1 Tax=Streptosporangium sp. NPDC048047 TaxID=3155748 RepID=UPI0034231407